MAKSGPKDTNLKGATAHNTVHNSGGSAGQSYQQQPISGPVSPGKPASLARALTKKNVGGGRGRNSPGSVL